MSEQLLKAQRSNMKVRRNKSMHLTIKSLAIVIKLQLIQREIQPHPVFACSPGLVWPVSVDNCSVCVESTHNELRGVVIKLRTKNTTWTSFTILVSSATDAKRSGGLWGVTEVVCPPLFRCNGSQSRSPSHPTLTHSEANAITGRDQTGPVHHKEAPP